MCFLVEYFEIILTAILGIYSIINLKKWIDLKSSEKIFTVLSILLAIVVGYNGINKAIEQSDEPFRIRLDLPQSASIPRRLAGREGFDQELSGKRSWPPISPGGLRKIQAFFSPDRQTRHRGCLDRVAQRAAHCFERQGRCARPVVARFAVRRRSMFWTS